MSLRGLVPDPPGNGDQSGQYLTMPGIGTHSQVARRESQSTRGLGLSRMPHVCPAVQPGRACYCNLHVNHAMLAPDQIDAMASQREVRGSSPLSSTGASARQDLLADHGVLWPEV